MVRSFYAIAAPINPYNHYIAMFDAALMSCTNTLRMSLNDK